MGLPHSQRSVWSIKLENAKNSLRFYSLDSSNGKSYHRKSEYGGTEHITDLKPKIPQGIGELSITEILPKNGGNLKIIIHRKKRVEMQGQKPDTILASSLGCQISANAISGNTAARQKQEGT